MRERRELDVDRISRSHAPAPRHDAHHAGEADDLAVTGVPHHLLEQPGLESVDLLARIAKPGDRHHSLSDSQSCSDGQREQIDAVRRDVLAEVPWSHEMTTLLQRLEELAVDQMHLPEIRLGRIGGHPRSVLDRRSTVRIAVDTQTLEERDRSPCLLAERVRSTGMDRDDPSEHVFIVPRATSRSPCNDRVVTPPTHAPAGYVCPFCAFLEGTHDDHNLPADVVAVTERAYARIAPKWWPGNPGAVLVIPRTHVENIYDLSPSDSAAVWDLTQRVAVGIRSSYACEGTSIRQHNEPAGGQDVWHLHVHVFPRYPDDRLYQRHDEAEWVGPAHREAFASRLRTALGMPFQLT